MFRHLDKYIIADDVTLEDVTEPLACVAVEGPLAAALVNAAGGLTPEATYAHALWGEAIVQRASATG